MENSGEKFVFLDRSSRATRGKRMNKLLDEELEEDEQFWNQDALKEEEIDNNYETEEEFADEFDSDFDDDESEPDDEAEVDVVDRDRTKKKLIIPGKFVSKKKSKKKVLTKLEAEPKEEKSSSTRQSDLPEQQDGPDDTEVEKTVRKSTRTAVMVRQAERDAIKAALQATMRPVKRKKEGEEKRMTQEEMLLEAAETEIHNLRNLERVLAREEEVKKRAVVHKEVYSGPQMRYISRDVTGAAAKYRDPKTGLYYATKEAFKIIRERYSEAENKQPEKKKIHRGDLIESVEGNGFLAKRKRSTPASISPTSFRYGARFLTIPALEFEDTD